MGRHGKLIAAGVVGLVVLLFAGRWTAVVLTDYWWGEQIAPATASFLLQSHLLRLSWCRSRATSPTSKSGRR
jgi:hypothetical protein